MCNLGTFSWSGAVGSASCFSIVPNFGNAGLFRLQDKRDGNFISASSAVNLAIMMPDNGHDPYQQLMYNPTTLQIYIPTMNLCLDDGGNEYLGGQSLSATLTFSPCDSTNPNQQFIQTTSLEICNPNWPLNTVCLNRNGAINAAINRQQLELWTRTAGNLDMQFNVLGLCAPGRPHISLLVTCPTTYL